MEDPVAKLQAEEAQIRDKIALLRQTLTTLEVRLEEIARAKQQRPRAAESTPLKPAAPARPVDPVEQLRQSPRGVALFARQGAGEDAVLLIRAASDRIDDLGKDPDVEFRTGLLTPPELGVALMPVLVRIGPEAPENLYEAWANEFPGGLTEVMAALGRQTQIAMQLYGDDHRLERTLAVANPFQNFAQQVLATLPAAQPASADALHQAKQAVYKQHPTARALWKALKG